MVIKFLRFMRISFHPSFKLQWWFYTTKRHYKIVICNLTEDSLSSYISKLSVFFNVDFKYQWRNLEPSFPRRCLITMIRFSFWVISSKVPSNQYRQMIFSKYSNTVSEFKFLFQKRIVSRGMIFTCWYS